MQRFSNCHLKFDACIQSVWTSWNCKIELRVRFPYFEIRYLRKQQQRNRPGYNLFPNRLSYFALKSLEIHTPIQLDLKRIFAAFLLYILRICFLNIFAVFYHILSYFCLSPGSLSPSPGFVVCQQPIKRRD